MFPCGGFRRASCQRCRDSLTRSFVPLVCSARLFRSFVPLGWILAAFVEPYAKLAVTTGLCEPGYVDDAYLRASLAKMEPAARKALRRTLIADQLYRDSMAERLIRERANGMADLLDFLTLYPDARRQAVRVLGEIEAEG
jgi:hypothetical protein